EWQFVQAPFTFDSIALGVHNQWWGIRFDGKPVFKHNADWSLVSDNTFLDIAVGAHHAVWALDANGSCWVRDGVDAKNLQGTAWLAVPCPEKIAHIAVGADHNVWVVAHDGDVYVRRGIQPTIMQGTDWKKVTGQALTNIAVGSDGQVWGVSQDYRIFKRVGITPTNLIGVGWRKVQGKMQKVAAATYPGVQPGGRAYTHFGLHDYEEAIFNDAWRFQEPGKGWVQFKARSKADLFLRFSPNPYQEKKSTIHVTLGAKKNTCTLATKLGCIEHITHLCDHGGLPQQEFEWEDYWASVENGVLRVGKSGQLGQNELVRFEDSALNNVCYVAFGGGKKYVHEFDAIQTDERPLEAKAVNVPAGFSVVSGKASRIAVGSRDNALLVCSVGFDGQIYRYYPYAGQQVWQKFSNKMVNGEEITRFKDVSVSSDGHLYALNSSGHTLCYHWERSVWKLVDQHHKLDRIVAGSATSVWGLRKKTQTVYQLISNGWRKADIDGVMALDAGLDGTVVAVNTAQEALTFNAQTGLWEKMLAVQGIGRIAVAHKDFMIGTRAVGNEYLCWQGNNKQWWRLTAGDKTGAYGFKQMAMNAAGTVFALDGQGAIYKKDGA
ncbi:hypothetical protein K2X40_05440, partial [Candidatus Babeliales bacterium]|nr:hypothetical protein [Candidatus Babeliales bacterium]